MAERKARKEGRGREDDKGIEREGKKGEENDVQRQDKTIKPPVSPAYSMAHRGKNPRRQQKQEKAGLLTLRTTSTNIKPDSKDIKHPK